MRISDSSITVNQYAQRHSTQTVLLRQVFGSHHYWIVQLLRPDEQLDHLPPLVIHRRADNREALGLIFVLELHVPRDFSLATMAPGCPKIEEDHSAFVIKRRTGAPEASVREKTGAGFREFSWAT